MYGIVSIMKIQILKTVLILLAIVICASAVFAQNRQLDRMMDFMGFLKRVDAAQLELQNGRPEAFKALWSQSDDITLSGGFGGTIEKG